MTAPVGIAYPSSLAQVAFGKEAAFGVAAAPTLLVPASQIERSDEVNFQVSTGWMGAPAKSYQHTPGLLTSSIALGGPLVPDSIGFLLAGVLGDGQFVAGSGGAANTWTFALQNAGTQQPPSYTVTSNDPIGQRVAAGCRVSNLDLTFDADQALSWSASLSGLTPNPGSYVMPRPSQELLLPGWSGQVQIGGLVDPRVLDLKITMQRDVVAKATVTETLEPYNQRADVLGVSGSATLVASLDTYSQSMITGASTSLNVAYTSVQGPARALSLHCSQVMLTHVNRSYGSRWVELDLQFEADANVSDVGASSGYSPIIARLQNGVAAGTYS